MSSIRRWLGRLALLALAAAAIAGGPAAARAQSATAAELKAAFLLNFAKFAQWPADVLPAGAPLTFCVVDAPAVAAALEHMAGTHTIGGRSLRVVRTAAHDAVSGCQILFAPALDEEIAAPALARLNGNGVFTVGDSEGFVRRGGVACLYTEGDRMRFAINVQAAQRARVTLSSRLLVLAKIVEGDAR